MVNFLLGDFMVWLPRIFYGAVLLAAVLVYAFRHTRHFHSKLINFKNLIICTVVFKFLYAVLASAGQYYIWTTYKFTEYFLNSPLSPDVPRSFVTELFPSLFEGSSGYFFYYVYGRFFINPVITILVALAFWLFLRSLKKYQDRFFDTHEVELGFLVSLIVGWPNILVFIPLTFLFIIILSMIRGIAFKEPYTTLGLPMIWAAFVSIVWGNILISALNLSVFRI